MVEYKLKLTEKTDNPNVTNYLVVEMSGNKQLADKMKKFIEDNAESEDWEVY